jgi:hypothetical protein
VYDTPELAGRWVRRVGCARLATVLKTTGRKVMAKNEFPIPVPYEFFSRPVFVRSGVNEKAFERMIRDVAEKHGAKEVKVTKNDKGLEVLMVRFPETEHGAWMMKGFEDFMAKEMGIQPFVLQKSTD